MHWRLIYLSSPSFDCYREDDTCDNEPEDDHFVYTSDGGKGIGSSNMDDQANEFAGALRV